MPWLTLQDCNHGIDPGIVRRTRRLVERPQDTTVAARRTTAPSRISGRWLRRERRWGPPRGKQAVPILSQRLTRPVTFPDGPDLTADSSTLRVSNWNNERKREVADADGSAEGLMAVVSDEGKQERIPIRPCARQGYVPQAR